MQTVQRLLTILAAALISGCATPNTSIAPEMLSRLKRVGVISVAANTFTRKHVGVTVFGNELETKDLSPWGMNAEYERQLASAVELTLEAKAIQAPYSSAEFSHVNDLNGPWENSSFWNPKWEAIEGATRVYCAANSLDAVVVAGRIKTDDLFARTNQSVEGVGIYSGRGTNLMHLLAVVGLIDCKTGTVVAARNVVVSRSASAFALPVTPVPEDVARTKVSDWTPQMEAYVKKMVATIPGSGWADTLKLIASGTK